MTSALATVQSNLLVQSLTLDRPLPPIPDTTSTLERNFSSFEEANATILAASLGLGVHIDVYA
jgi:hypothetical protein